MNVMEINVLVLAYLGDSIYENYVRRYLVDSGIGNVNDLQTASIKYVSAMNQAKFVLDLLDKDLLTDAEVDVYKRARNYKTTSHPKSCDIITYKNATGLEAIIGYLSMVGNNDRIEEIMKIILGG